MATSTIYIPIEVTKNNCNYTIHKQQSYGNNEYAKKIKRSIKLRFPEPTYLIRRLGGHITIYIKD